MKYKKPKVILLQASPLFVSEIAARVCYDSFELSENEVIKNFKEHFDINMSDIETSDVLDKLTWVHFHGSIVEHTTLSFFIKDLSREVLQELARHRVGVNISVKSTRYTIEKLVNAFIELITNDTIENADNFRNIIKENTVVENESWIDIETTALYNKLKLYHQEEPLIKGLVGSKKKKQNDRVKRCLPETWTTELVLTFNLRSFKHFVGLRDSGAAYYGIRELTEAIIDNVPENYMRYIKKVID